MSIGPNEERQVSWEEKSYSTPLGYCAFLGIEIAVFYRAVHPKECTFNSKKMGLRGKETYFGMNPPLLRKSCTAPGFKLHFFE